MMTQYRAGAHDELANSVLRNRPRPTAGDAARSPRLDESDTLRRFRQLRLAEERLRPLRETRLAHVYWRVRDELERLVHGVLSDPSGRGRRPLQ